MKSLSSKIGVDVTSDEADSTFNQFDKNKDQAIDITEFSQILQLVSASH
ncbi:MAG: hypothetical protein E6Q89_04260 [Bacteroidia bacterium]|nr:MAG: hypothetical protein E6Q89_04260 [Bacteroidia bacterium]